MNKLIALFAVALFYALIIDLSLPAHKKLVEQAGGGTVTTIRTHLPLQDTIQGTRLQ